MKARMERTVILVVVGLAIMLTQSAGVSPAIAGPKLISSPTKVAFLAYEQNPPAIDGLNTDAVWDRAWMYTGFTVAGDSKKAAPVKTEFQMTYGRTHLYFFLTCYESKKRIRIATKRPNEEVWAQDSSVDIVTAPTWVNCWLGRAPDDEKLMRLAINPSGNFDVWVTSPGDRNKIVLLYYPGQL